MHFSEMLEPSQKCKDGMLNIYVAPFAGTVRCVHHIANGILIMRLTCPIARACLHGGALDFIVFQIFHHFWSISENEVWGGSEKNMK